jgi:hypothetical protein
MPIVILPGAMADTVVATFAKTAGVRIVDLVTSEPALICGHRETRYAIVVQHSNIGRLLSPLMGQR